MAQNYIRNFPWQNGNKNILTRSGIKYQPQFLKVQYP